ncbi:MAG TPA: regulatory protein RecX [Archangium sp.]
MTKARPDALTQATKLLAGRDKSRAQLRAALLQRGYDDEETDAALQRAAELGYLDDARVAERKAREALDDGWAGEVLVAKLVAGGLEESVAQRAVDEVIAATGWDALKAARKLAEKRRLEGEKAARFLASRGFEEDVISRLVPVP